MTKRDLSTPLSQSVFDKDEKKKKKSTKKVDMSTTELLKSKWAEYQKTLSKDHPDYGKPVPTQKP
tara:strand:- start:3623 stop:3817 length:195 start_codon:yes stop_codon:yes gene_type:complete